MAGLKSLRENKKKQQVPTGAYPDFLPRSTGQGRVCAFL
jgi:hypothetical protein